jgi:hypothetical protein
MNVVGWDPHDVLVTLGHPFGQVDLTLHEWMLSGPGLRQRVRPIAARSRLSGETLPLAVIPVPYRNDRRSRALIEAGEIESPWLALPSVGKFLLPDYDRFSALLRAKYLSQETVAVGGRLITATARLCGLLLRVHLLGLGDGLPTPGEWVAIIEDTRRALDGYDRAWSDYESELADYRPGVADRRLRTAVNDTLDRIGELIGRLPEAGYLGGGDG